MLLTCLLLQEGAGKSRPQARIQAGSRCLAFKKSRFFIPSSWLLWQLLESKHDQSSFVQYQSCVQQEPCRRDKQHTIMMQVLEFTAGGCPRPQGEDARGQPIRTCSTGQSGCTLEISSFHPCAHESIKELMCYK